jgi:hypothetical protein
LNSHNELHKRVATNLSQRKVPLPALNLPQEYTGIMAEQATISDQEKAEVTISTAGL